MSLEFRRRDRPALRLNGPALPVRLVVFGHSPAFCDDLAPDFETMFVSSLEELDRALRVCRLLLVDVRGRDESLLVARMARERSLSVVVLGDGEEAESPRYLDAGAVEYLSASMAPMELRARLRAAARWTPRSPGETEPDYVLGDVSVWVARYEVRKAGRPVRLTPNEFRLLEALLVRADRRVLHNELIAAVWGPEYVSARHYLRLYIRQLRQKLEDDPDDPKLIITDWGQGYALGCQPTGARANRDAGAASA